MNYNDSTREWERRAAASRQQSVERRLRRTEERSDLSWSQGFLVGLSLGFLIAVAWFAPLV